MGAGTSKATRAAAGSAARRYPSRSSPATSSNPPASSSSFPPDVSPSSAAASSRRPGPTVHPTTTTPQASGTRDETIDLDGSDPDFARSLRTLGAVQPNPTRSPSSRFGDLIARKDPAASSGKGERIAGARGGPPVGPDPRANPALTVLVARQRIAEEAEREAGMMGRKGFEGRRFADVGTIRQALSLRERGLDRAKVEEMLELKRGTVAVLEGGGRVGVVDLSHG